MTLNPFFLPAREITTFKRQFVNAQYALNDEIRQCYTIAKQKTQFASKSTSNEDLVLVFASSTNAPNFLAAFALPLVVAFAVNDLVAPRRNEPFRCMHERKSMVHVISQVCRSVSAMLRIAQDFIYANWCEQIVPVAFRKRPEIRFLRFAKNQLAVWVCKEQLRENRRTKRNEAPTFRFTIENVSQLRNNPGKTHEEQETRRAMLESIFDAFAERLIEF